MPNGGSGVAPTELERYLWPCLDLCFASHFRVVLAACLHALKKPAEANYTTAHRFIAHRLLEVPPAPSGGSDGDTAMPDADGPVVPATVPQGQQQPLAPRVLGSLAPKDQAWVRSHVEKWSKGTRTGALRPALQPAAGGGVGACACRTLPRTVNRALS